MIYPVFLLPVTYGFVTDHYLQVRTRVEMILDKRRTNKIPLRLLHMIAMLIPNLFQTLKVNQRKNPKETFRNKNR
ncbi:unnamed protein product [Acanthoscelides obtectus]|uniref:Uncharacterized protein n=1 Tax=Acanthoscelides obtectus TaxID=200917 RepID=A0A9P0PY21_ACAOB|nr:unnamed protein product [Acanthoscelides obtectus]CAK1675389.1 hypothetical protein AOBTE_LOCUS30190 [Acanthoscelides obtectus]